MGSFLVLQYYYIVLLACLNTMKLFCFLFIAFCFFNHSCSVVQLEVMDGDSTKDSFIIENSFCNTGFFVIPDEFENCSFYLCEELSWNFDGDCIESVDCFWQDSPFYYIDPADS